MNAIENLFQRAIADSDAALMRDALERLFSGSGGVSAAEEYALRADEFVLEIPQSGERITGRDRMRAMQESFPGPPPTIAIQRVTGSGRGWLVEAASEYAPGDRWHVVLTIEFGDDGRIRRERRYYAQDFEPPAWRAAFTGPS